MQSLASEGALPSFWLVVPTYNPGLHDWTQWFQALQAQNSQPAQVVIVDSGSTDGSLALTEQWLAKSRLQPTGQTCDSPPYALLHIKADQFDHGGTRQWALNQVLQSRPEAHPEVVVFMTQDAVLAQPNALGNLLAAFQNPKVAAAYGRQLPKSNATWQEHHARHFNYPAQSRTVQLHDKASLGLKVCFFSNAFGAYRLSALLALGGLPANLPLGEDTFTAAQLLLSGQSLQYQADALVYHSHQYNGIQDFQRMFDTGVFHAQNPWLVQSFGRAEGEGWRSVRSELAQLRLLSNANTSLTKPHPSAPSLISGLLQMLFTMGVKYFGYKLGQWHRLLPKRVKHRLSMYKSYWNQQA